MPKKTIKTPRSANATLVHGTDDGFTPCSGDIKLTLPSAAASGGQGTEFTFKKTDYDNNVEIAAASGETIDGKESVFLWHENHAVTIVSDGTNWYMV